MRNRERKQEKMGRQPCCDKGEVKKGAWTPEEDKILLDYITKNGHGTWRSFPKLAGLRRCGKSCRLRWTNYLRPDIKRGTFNIEEEQTIFQLHSLLGNKWAAIASRLPGRTDNEIKNYWNSHLRKRIPNNLQAKSAETKSKLLSMAEWESGRLSMDPMLLSPATGVDDCDYLMRAWNSEAGEAFQRAKNLTQVAHAQAQGSSMIKVESDSVITMQAEPAYTITSTGDQRTGKHMVEATNSSYKAEKSSDLTLDLLLDFPNDSEYLEYLQGEPSDNDDPQ